MTGEDPIDVPYCDEDLRLIALLPHTLAVRFFQSVLEPVASGAGLRLFSDNPVRYVHPELQEERDYGPDIVLAGGSAGERTLAAHLRLVIEVVSTQDSRKERKDTVFTPSLNLANDVPEFALFFPDVWDSRSFELHVRDPNLRCYRPVAADAQGRWESSSVPGLAFVLLPRTEWREGRKLDGYWRGQRVADAEEARAELARQRQSAEEHERRAEALAAKLRALGIDPDA